MVALIPLMASILVTQPQPSRHPAHGPERMGSHGMLLVGGADEAFLSHIPMFRRPHDVQLILAVRLSHPDWQTPPDFSQTLHTLLPEPLDLTALLEGRLKSFTGTVHRGNFEADGPPLYRGTKVEVLRVVRSAVLSERGAGPPGPDQLFVFGTPAQAFAVHVLGPAPSYDQLLRVDTTGVTPARLRDGLLVPRSGKLAGTTRARKGEVLPVPGGGKLQVRAELSHLAGPEFVPAAATNVGY